MVFVDLGSQIRGRFGDSLILEGGMTLVVVFKHLKRPVCMSFIPGIEL